MINNHLNNKQLHLFLKILWEKNEGATKMVNRTACMYNTFFFFFFFCCQYLLTCAWHICVHKWFDWLTADSLHRQMARPFLLVFCCYMLYTQHSDINLHHRIEQTLNEKGTLMVLVAVGRLLRGWTEELSTMNGPLWWLFESEATKAELIVRVLIRSVDVAEQLCVALHTVVMGAALRGLETCWDFHLRQIQVWQLLPSYTQYNIHPLSFSTEGWFRLDQNKDMMIQWK